MNRLHNCGAVPRNLQQNRSLNAINLEFAAFSGIFPQCRNAGTKGRRLGCPNAQRRNFP